MTINPTIDELVTLLHPTSVAINNPKLHNIPTPGTARVSSFEVKYDEAYGILMWITIE